MAAAVVAIAVVRDKMKSFDDKNLSTESARVSKNQHQSMLDGRRLHKACSACFETFRLFDMSQREWKGERNNVVIIVRSVLFELVFEAAACLA